MCSWGLLEGLEGGVVAVWAGISCLCCMEDGMLVLGDYRRLMRV